MEIQLTQEAESRTNDHMQSPSPKTHLSVRFWGTRGSCAAPFPDRMIYGGNTSCVSVHWEEGTAIFDAGTGILALGEWMKRKKKQKSQYTYLSAIFTWTTLPPSLYSRFYLKKKPGSIYTAPGKKKNLQKASASASKPAVLADIPGTGSRVHNLARGRKQPDMETSRQYQSKRHALQSSRPMLNIPPGIPGTIRGLWP